MIQNNIDNPVSANLEKITRVTESIWDFPKRQKITKNENAQDFSYSIEINGIEKNGVNPNEEKHIIGWLYCVSGNNIGEAIPFYKEQNLIGKDENSDIRIVDLYVNDNHALLTFDSHESCYYIEPIGDSILSINNKVVQSKQRIDRYYIIGVGISKNYKYVFIPLIEKGKFEINNLFNTSHT